MGAKKATYTLHRILVILKNNPQSLYVCGLYFLIQTIFYSSIILVYSGAFLVKAVQIGAVSGYANYMFI